MIDVFGDPIPEGAIVIPHTELPGFRQCRRSWYLSSANGLSLRPKLADSRLRMGTVWHSFLAEYYCKTYDSAYNLLRQVLVAERDKIQALSGELFEVEALLAQQREQGELLLLLASLYPGASEELVPTEFQTTAVEQRITIRVPDPTGVCGAPVYLSAKPDMIVRHNDQYYVWDHKLVGKTTNIEVPGVLSIDLQMGLQMWAVQEMLRQCGRTDRVDGAIYNMARKQAPGPKVKNPLFARHVIHRSQAELENIHDQILINAHEMNLCRFNPLYRWHNPQPYLWLCQSCAFRDACEAMNRDENVELILSYRFEKRMHETREEEGMDTE